MNTKILSIALVSATIAFTSCNNKKEAIEQPVEAIDTAATQVEPAADTTAVVTAPAHKDGEAIEITGEVTEFNQGKDGYTAKLKTAEGKMYSATISIPNLDNPKQYRAVKAGDKITVKGEVTNLGTETLIIVRELK